MIPPFQGGQGRSARDVRSCGTSLALTFGAGLLVLALAVLAHYWGTP